MNNHQDNGSCLIDWLYIINRLPSCPIHNGQVYAFARCLWYLSREGFLSCYICYDMRHRFRWSHLTKTPLTTIPGSWEPILTRVYNKILISLWVPEEWREIQKKGDMQQLGGESLYCLSLGGSNVVFCWRGLRIKCMLSWERSKTDLGRIVQAQTTYLLN